MARRKTKGKKVKKRVLILCEGQTERNYFQALKESPEYKKALSAVTTQVLTAKHSTPEQIVQEAEKIEKAEDRAGNPYDKIWLVFDHDNHPHRRTAYDQAIRGGFSVCFNAISFEMWLLLHFEHSARSFPDAGQLIGVLKPHYPDFDKAKSNDYANLKGRLPTAMERAPRLRTQIQSQQLPRHQTDFNPWTEVDLLIDYLNSLKS